MEQQGYQKALGLPQQQSVFSKDQHALPIVGHSDWRRELRRTILTRVVPRLSDRFFASCVDAVEAFALDNASLLVVAATHDRSVATS